MSNKETNTGLEEIFKTSLQEAKMKARAAYGKDTKEEGEEEEGEEEEEDGEKSHGKDKNKDIDGEESSEKEEKVRTKKVDKEKAGQMKGKVDEETLAAASLHPAARSVPDPKALTKSKIGMMQHMLGAMNGMSKSTLIDFFNKSMADFGPNKNWGIGDVAGKNASSIDMQPSDLRVQKQNTQCQNLMFVKTLKKCLTDRICQKNLKIKRQLFLKPLLVRV